MGIDGSIFPTFLNLCRLLQLTIHITLKKSKERNAKRETFLSVAEVANPHLPHLEKEYGLE